MAKKTDFKSKEKEILEAAQRAGLEQDYFFTTAFKRYKVQLNILDGLEKELETTGVMIEKEYATGRTDIITHPAVNDYNRTATAANQTVQTILKIITTLAEHSISDGAGEEDEL